MNIQFKLATSHDIATLNNLMKLSKQHWGYDDSFMEKFMEHYHFTEEQLATVDTFLMIVHDIPVGMYGFKINNDQILELDSFFLHPSYIGKGLGKRLWNEAVKTAQGYNAKKFIIYADPYAESFYQKMGCYTIGMQTSPIEPKMKIPVLEYIL